MIQRSIEREVIYLLSLFPAVALVGPRQIGKTTLANALIGALGKPVIYLDLESEQDLQMLNYAEQFLLENQDKTVIIDEVQLKPSLFPLLRSVIDRKREDGRFLLLGSASPYLMSRSGETLAGRIAYLEVQPLDYLEVNGVVDYNQHWLRGGFPKALLAKSEEGSMRILANFVKTYAERDLALLGLGVNPKVIMQLLSMLTAVHGNLLNISTLSRSLGLSSPTVKSYINFLEQSYLIRQLEPWFINVSKRIVKAPKLYFIDSGIFHSIAGISSYEMLLRSIYRGASWEGYVIQQVIGRLSFDTNAYFYRTADEAELDLVLVKGVEPVLGIEIKISNAPELTKGTYSAQKELKGLPVIVVTPTSKSYTFAEGIVVRPLAALWSELAQYHVLRS